jgi:hypothetical protein
MKAATTANTTAARRLARRHALPLLPRQRRGVGCTVERFDLREFARRPSGDSPTSTGGRAHGQPSRVTQRVQALRQAGALASERLPQPRLRTHDRASSAAARDIPAGAASCAQLSPFVGKATSRASSLHRPEPLRPVLAPIRSGRGVAIG